MGTEYLVNLTDSSNHWDVQVARSLLDRYILVGLLEEIEESVRRFTMFFGWQPMGINASARLWEDLHHGQNVHPHPELALGSPAAKALADMVQADMELYHRARELFVAQAHM